MTVGELIETLKSYSSDMEVRIAYQPSWPLQSEIHDAMTAPQGDEEEDDDIVFIVSGDYSGYANKALWK